MKILVVEDDRKKRDQIVEVLKRIQPGAHVEEHRSYYSGLTSLLEAPPNLLILDMTMPTYDLTRTEPGGRTRPYAGREIMEEMVRAGIAVPVVVVTGFDVFGAGRNRTTLDELRKQLDEEFGDIYIGAIHYDASSTRWTEELAKYLGKAEKRTG